MSDMVIQVKSQALDGAEVAWFAPICNGDDRYIGAHADQYKSTWTNAAKIVMQADRLGYRNILCPSSYQVGQDTWTFAAAIAPHTQHINLLAAIRCGELHPPMLGRSIATLDHILNGRLTINIISSDLPGRSESSEVRYQRSREVIEILRQGWTQDRIVFRGDHYNLELPSDPMRPYQQNGGPLLYFGGYSDAGQDLCAEHCDVYLMWPETLDRLRSLMADMTKKANAYGRIIDFGLRIHVIVRETESQAREAARQLMSHVDDEAGKSIRERALDAHSKGVSRQAEMREVSDTEGFVEDHLWTGIGRARSGCGAAIVGDPDQVLSKIQSYMDLGIRAFILSGYPHMEECALFAKYVLPRMTTYSLPKVYGRIPDRSPLTPLGAGSRRLFT